MPSAAILPASLTIPRHSNQTLSSCRALTGADLFRPFSLSSYFAVAVDLPSAAIIRMGGGPRTFPGGVSKWQWKRMQAKKAKQLLKARLCRERQLYEMRKRAELKAAISELERPWEVVERAPVLFSVSADEQVKVLADRFQRPTGFDMWSERDGPQLFRSPDSLPSARFFPKGVVHSVKPYSAVAGEIPDGGGGSDEGGVAMRYNDWIARGAGGIGTGRRARRVLSDSILPENVTPDPKKLIDGDTGESQGFDSELLHGQNHGLHGSDMMIGVTGLNTEEDEMAGEYDWDNGRSRVSRLSDSELDLDDSRMEGHKRAGGFRRRRGGQEGLGWNRNTHQSNYALPVSGSRMEGDGMANDVGSRIGRSSNQRFYGSDSEIVVSSSRMQRHKLSGDFNRRGGRGGYGGRNGNRGFYLSNSMLQNQVSSEIRVGGSRMNGHEMAGGFSRCDGRGGRSGYRSYSDSAINDSRFNRHMAGNFSRHRDHGRSRDSRGSNSDRPVAGKKMEAGDIAGSFAGRGGHRGRGGNRDSYETYSDHGSRVKGNSFGRRGGRGRFQGSYGVDSELIDAGSSKSTEMTGDFGRSGGGWGYKNAGSFSLRPTTQLKLAGGGRGRRGRKWREEE